MRTAITVTTLMLAAGCGSSATTPPPAPQTNTPPPPTTTSSPAPAVLTWGASGTSSGVLIRLDTPQPSADPVTGADGKPDPTQRYVMLPGTAHNQTPGKARLTFKGRVGQKEAPPVAAPGDALGEYLPGENGQIQQRFRVPVGATELIVEVYANIDQQPTQNRLTFKGPLT